MKVITIEHPQIFNPEEFPPIVIALGFFDGIHIGHQKVIQTAKDAAMRMDAKSAVMTFDPHPSAVLGNDKQSVQYITPLQEKIEIIEKLGVDYVFVIHFTKEFAMLTPQQFVDDYLINLRTIHVVAGFDFSYGRFGEGTMDTLSVHSKGQFTQTVVEKQTMADEKISSTKLRKTLQEGDFIDFNKLTGRWYSVRGTVIHGEKRGRKLGFPTANIDIKDRYIFPSTGVYAVKIQIDHKWFNGVCNVGYKPTFHEERPKYPSVEVHVLGFDRVIYGEEVTVEWHKRLRSEQKFDGLEQLVQQIEIDKMDAIEYFAHIEE
ncbi:MULTISPECIES: bifunctional riboflavin kinase/FAD synthetase [Bacillaceae]|uniref:Riboflavin biosynthesis protein n=1 Tax=Peribacillus huizhouensis TaxID=1501239 RepID=A0ABR6CJN8_9BACI|nr:MULTISPECIES: bifunctional riboflavin kinase/FAD synthetase [Bacillaceae]MBA9024823.1 riboflavin kinase/FMN adenylyltransferase [Peribacillus huizhouensis]